MWTTRLPSFLSIFSEYPVTRPFKRRHTGLIILLLSASILTGLIIFNALSQQYWYKTTPYLFLRDQNKSFPDWKNISLVNITCDTPSLKVGDMLLMEHTARKDVNREAYRAPPARTFRWEVTGLGSTQDGISGGILGTWYFNPRMKCNVTHARITYEFQEEILQYYICAQCLQPDVQLCTAFPKYPLDQNILYRQLLRDIRQNHNPSLSIPSASLSLSAFPPDYDQNGNREGEVLRQKNITAHEVSKLSIWLGSVRMMPPPVWIYPSDSNSTEIELPGAMVFLNESEQPIDYFEAFRATSPSRQSGFQISVIGTGIVRPLGNQLNLLAIPDGLAMYFNSSFSALGRMIDLGIYDLDGAELSGLMRVCNVTEKYLYPVMRRISITLAGALGAFGPIFAVLIAAAKQLDSLRKKKSPASLPESNTESGNQSTPNVIEDEEAFLPKETT